jgi:hypothetical protein
MPQIIVSVQTGINQVLVLEKVVIVGLWDRVDIIMHQRVLLILLLFMYFFILFVH